MGRLGVRGVAFYRTTFEHAGAARLQFQACSFYCRVFVDGKEIKKFIYVPGRIVNVVVGK